MRVTHKSMLEIHLHMHRGAWPFHSPSFKHSRNSFPIRMNPQLHMYVAMEPIVIALTLTWPFSITSLYAVATTCPSLPNHLITKLTSLVEVLTQLPPTHVNSAFKLLVEVLLGHVKVMAPGLERKPTVPMSW